MAYFCRMIPDFVVAAAEGKDIVIYGDGSETGHLLFCRRYRGRASKINEL